MKNESTVHITIEYKLTDSNSWEFLELTPDEYFELEANEKVSLDSIPQHNHAIQYLGIEHQRVSTTKIILIDEAKKVKRTLVERFWNKGENRLIERTDIADKPYSEIILEIQVSKEPPLWEIIRIGREDGVLTPWYHAFLQDNDDGSQTETRIETSLNF